MELSLQAVAAAAAAPMWKAGRSPIALPIATCQASPPRPSARPPRRRSIPWAPEREAPPAVRRDAADGAVPQGNGLAASAASGSLLGSPGAFGGYYDELDDYVASQESGKTAPVTADPETAGAATPRRTLKINVDLLIYKARQLRRTNKSKAAEALFRRIIAMDPADGRAYVALARMLEDRRQLEDARKLYESAVAAVGGDNPFVWQAWAVFESRCNNISKARDLFDSALVSDQRHAPSWHAWGLMEKKAGDVRKARNLWVKGARLCPENAFLYQSLALLEAESGRLEQARQYFMLGTRAVPDSPALWQAWALMEADAGNDAEARRLFERGIKECPRNRFIWLAWGLWEAKRGGAPAKARALLQKGAELNRRDPAIWQAWAIFEHEQGDAEKARTLFETALKADPKHQPVWQAYGLMEFKEGNTDKARDLFQRGVWADPQNKNVATVFQAWGVMEDRLGNVNVARSLYKCAIKADSSSVPSWLAWAQMEDRLGNITRAEELRLYCLQQRMEVKLDLRPADAKLITAAAESLRQDPQAVLSGRYYKGKPLPGIFDQIAVWFASQEAKRDARAALVKRAEVDGEQTADGEGLAGDRQVALQRVAANDGVEARRPSRRA